VLQLIRDGSFYTAIIVMIAVDFHNLKESTVCLFYLKD